MIVTMLGRGGVYIHSADQITFESGGCG
jgi:hypothetical protein